MRKMLVVVALVLAFSGYAYAQGFNYRQTGRGTDTVYAPDGSWFQYGTRRDGSTYTDFQPEGSWFINRQETGGPTRSYPSRGRYR
jgi:hypothetical protein